jgi:hypothetical protein
MEKKDKLEFPLLTESQIEVRIATYKEGKGASLLLYKDARCDANILDSVLGPENWQCRFYECKGNLFCSVGIRINGEWIWKDDCGAESNVEKQKGEASDSFKRACFKWGLGRELYTAPFIWVPADKLGDKFDRFEVEKIAYNDKRQITGLSIKKVGGNRVFVWKKEESNAKKQAG